MERISKKSPLYKATRLTTGSWTIIDVGSSVAELRRHKHGRLKRGKKLGNLYRLVWLSVFSSWLKVFNLKSRGVLACGGL